MTEKRFQYNVNKNTIEYDGKFVAYLNSVDGCRIANYWNGLYKENEQLKEKLKKYEEIEELKKQDFVNCHNCKNNESVHDGVTLDGMCAIDKLMNIDGYFDTKYHRLPTGTFCPCWELEE